MRENSLLGAKQNRMERTRRHLRDALGMRYMLYFSRGQYSQVEYEKYGSVVVNEVVYWQAKQAPLGRRFHTNRSGVFAGWFRGQQYEWIYRSMRYGMSQHLHQQKQDGSCLLY